MIARDVNEFQEVTADPLALFKSAEDCLRARNIVQALHLYNEAERAGYDPDVCGGARWICQMLLGDLAEAWRESDIIQKRGNADPNRFWSGESLAGQRVMIRCLHGLGDTLQFVRYAGLLRRSTKHLTIEAQPSLKTLIAQSNLADHVMTWGEVEPAYDQQIEVVELPRIFGTTLESVPAHVPYLQAPSATRSGAERKRIGLVWASSRYNTARSVPFSCLETLMRRRPDVEFCSFQAAPERQDLAQCGCPVTDLFAESADLLIAAQRLRSMDLILTVDTMMAHLAGALGLPVWTMLPFEADWRWMLQRTDSPWYPTMKLFRQPSPGDWISVVESVIQHLNQMFPAGPTFSSESSILPSA